MGTPRIKQTRKSCLCGCGLYPKLTTSRYCHSHDATHRSNLLRRMRQDADIGAAHELYELGWVKAKRALLELHRATLRRRASAPPPIALAAD